MSEKNQGILRWMISGSPEKFAVTCISTNIIYLTQSKNADLNHLITCILLFM